MTSLMATCAINTETHLFTPDNTSDSRIEIILLGQRGLEWACRYVINSRSELVAHDRSSGLRLLCLGSPCSRLGLDMVYIAVSTRYLRRRIKFHHRPGGMIAARRSVVLVTKYMVLSMNESTNWQEMTKTATLLTGCTENIVRKC